MMHPILASGLWASDLRSRMDAFFGDLGRGHRRAVGWFDDLNFYRARVKEDPLSITIVFLSGLIDRYSHDHAEIRSMRHLNEEFEGGVWCGFSSLVLGGVRERVP
jgi:hypothetical protein